VLEDDIIKFDPDNIAEIQLRARYSLKFLPKGQVQEEEKKQEVESDNGLQSVSSKDDAQV